MVQKSGQSLDVSLNLKLAQNYYNDNKFQKKIEQEDKVEWFLTNFIALGTIYNNPESCTANAFGTMKLVKKKLSTIEKLDHLNKLFEEVANNHGNLCRQKYYTAITTSLDESHVDQVLMDDIGFIVDDLIASRTSNKINSSNALYEKVISADGETLISSSDAKQLYAKCKNEFGGDTKRETLAECVMKPCKELASWLGMVFALASMDNLKPLKDDDAVDFYQTWSKVEYCQTFIKRGVTKLVVEV